MHGISSAEPRRLLAYSDLDLRLDEQVAAESVRLAGTLQQFEAQCTEPGCQVDVGQPADSLGQHGTESGTLGEWVRSVARGFLLADSGSIWAGQLPAWPALPPGWRWPWPGIRIPWLPIIIEVLPFPPWLWPIIIGPPWFPKPVPTPTVPGPQPIPVPTPAIPSPGIVTPVQPIAPGPGFDRLPVPPDKITWWQPYGDTAFARQNPSYYLNTGGIHNGIDLGVPDGTPIMSPISGTGKVISVNGVPYRYGANEPGSIVVDYGDLIVVYGHTSQSNVKVGDEVRPGDKLGLTGSFDGPHLHLEVVKKDPSWENLTPEEKAKTRPGSERVDPLPYLPPELQELLKGKTETGVK